MAYVPEASIITWTQLPEEAILTLPIQNEEDKVNRILRELGLEGAESIVLIDARSDNKPSASKA